MVVLSGSRMTQLALAEALLDLVALQQVGVRLVLVSTGNGEAHIDQLLIEGELKWQAASFEAEKVQAILERGQLALVEAPGAGGMDAEIVDLAVSLDAFKLISLRPKLSFLVNAISTAEALSWTGEEAEILRQAGEICEGGIPRVHLLDEDHQGVLMDELFSNEGVGIMVYADDYLSIRAIGSDDIAELLAMVGRSMRDAHLVPRSYEEIENHLDDFLVMTIDGNVVGCVALHVSAEPHCAEVACLYVKQTHGGQGYGQMLVEAAEERARELGVPWVFALSTRAASYFTESLGYEACEQDLLPESRRQKLESSGRGSTVIRKTL